MVQRNFESARGFRDMTYFGSMLFNIGSIIRTVKEPVPPPQVNPRKRFAKRSPRQVELENAQNPLNPSVYSRTAEKPVARSDL